MSSSTADDFSDAFAEVKATASAWLAEHWDADLEVREWWTRFAESGWAFPHWSTEWNGRGLPAWSRVAVAEAVHEQGVLAAPDSPGQSFGAHALLGFGTDAQCRRFIPLLARGEEFWCQLFSEPGAGSDLASLQTRAERRDGHWVVNGQKTWSSAAQFASRGLLLARTNRDAPKHQGITLFVVDLDQPGVTTRPIRQMNNRSEFTEVFLDDVEVPSDCAIGDVDSGWRVATLVLAYERQEVGGSGPPPGRQAGLLEARAGDVADGVVSGPTIGLTFGHNLADVLANGARACGHTEDPASRLALADVLVLNAALDAVRRRVWSAAATGKPPGPGASVSKLAFAQLARAARDVAVDQLASAALIESSSDAAHEALREAVLTIPGLTIGQGTDEIQRNILSERVLQMPRERLVDGSDATKVEVTVR